MSHFSRIIPGQILCIIHYTSILFLVLINEQCGEPRVGFAAVSCVYFIISGVWWAVMKTFRSRELDLWGQQQPVCEFTHLIVGSQGS